MINATWSENVILVDADYVDKVAFDLIVNFERMLERRIPPADMARWLDCVALDGGLRPAENSQSQNEIQVVLIHSHKQPQLDNFRPARYTDELDRKAFTDNIGEFQISSVSAENMVSTTDLFIDSLQIISNAKEVKRLMAIGNTYEAANAIRQALRHAHDEQHITLFSMQPQPGGNYRQEILGYSLMAALGIQSKEVIK